METFVDSREGRTVVLGGKVLVTDVQVESNSDEQLNRRLKGGKYQDTQYIGFRKYTGTSKYFCFARYCAVNEMQKTEDWTGWAC